MENTDWKIPSWDELFMRHAYLIATKSKDPHSKIGAVIVKNNIILSEGYNGIPRNVNDSILERNDRPEKYYWYEHAERNAIFNCAREGIRIDTATLYCFATPCSDCARALIQSGIIEVVIHEEWDLNIGFNKNSIKWAESIKRTNDMFKESGIKFRRISMNLNLKTMVNGNIYTI